MDLQDLYKDIIVDHNRSPRHFGKLEEPTHRAEGFNPLCGDRLTLYLRVIDGVIEDIAFEGSGCAISVASASLLTEALLGKTPAEADALFAKMRMLFTGEKVPDDLTELGKLAALAGVRAYPSRVKCANLSWHALHKALESGTGELATAKTE